MANKLIEKLQVEARMREIIAGIENGQRPEDQTVELKAQWLDDSWKMARLLAAHCNACAGANALWIIGVDEKQGVVGAGDLEIANCWPQMEKHFDSVAPALIGNLNIIHDSKSVVGLLIETDRAPFVITVPPDVSTRPSREIPWRDGNRTESATRSNLVDLLASGAAAPLVDVRRATFTYRPAASSEKATTLRCDLYVTPRSNESTAVPRHMLKCYLRQGTNAAEIPVAKLNGAKDSQTLHTTLDQVVMRTPGMLYVHGGTGTSIDWLAFEEPISLDVRMGVPLSHMPAVVSVQLNPRDRQAEGDPVEWRYSAEVHSLAQPRGRRIRLSDTLKT